jgi:selenocysteine lyase/cysteine desulfurase
MLSIEQIRGIRSRFRIFERRIFLNSCSQGALSDAVQAGMEEYLQSWHEQGSPWELWMERYEEARAEFAGFINASPDEVAIVTSVSAGINGVASALPFRDRKKVGMGEFEFPTMGHVWLGQRPRTISLVIWAWMWRRTFQHLHSISTIGSSTCIEPLPLPTYRRR